MSAPNDDGNPWLSLTDLLQNKISVAKLATVIEKYGIQTYDRFGRRIAATDEGAEAKVSRANALDLLAKYYFCSQDRDNDPDVNPDRWFDDDSLLFDFGWPADEAPDFDKIEVEENPKPRKPTKRDIDAPPPTLPRRSYLTVIASLCNCCKIDIKIRGASQRIKKATETFGYPVDDGTITTILTDIPEALAARSK